MLVQPTLERLDRVRWRDPSAWAGAVRKNFADFFPAVMPPIPARPTDGNVA